MLLLYIAVGSAAGGVTRYLLGGAIQRAMGLGFPAGTLVINLTGSLLLGLILRHALTSGLTPELRGLLAIGFCGGYTTFSTFSYETMDLLQQGDWLRAGTYVILSVVGALAATAAGFAVAPYLAGWSSRP